MIRKVLMSSTVLRTMTTKIYNKLQSTKTTSAPLGYHTREHKQYKHC